MKKLLAAAMACSAIGLVGVSPSFAVSPNGNSYGYWAGRLCDHVGPTTNGMTYWESRGYTSRGACIRAEGQSLARGEWDPETLDPDQYPI